MNRSFINLIVESYLSDNELEIEKKDSAAQNIIDLMEEIKETDYQLYNFIHEMPKSKQKDLIYSVLNENLEVLSFGTLGYAFFVLIAIFSYAYFERGPNWFQRVSGFFNRVGGTILYARKAIGDRWSKSDKATDMIISNNYHDCTNKCEISAKFNNATIIRSLNKLYSKHGFEGIKRGVFLFKNKEFLSPEQLNCLVTCSLDTISSIIAKYAGLYINCVKKSDVIHADTKIHGILDMGRLPADISSCKELRDNYKELYDNYIYILELIFKGSNRKDNADQEYNKWISILERKINAISDNNYSGILNVSKQYVGDDKIPNPAVRFG